MASQANPRHRSRMRHLKYFSSVEEFFDLADWYLSHEAERKKIADAGMKRAHEQFNSVKIAGYLLDLVEKGSYDAPWCGVGESASGAKS